jgi:hypothetical protein
MSAAEFAFIKKQLDDQQKNFLKDPRVIALLKQEKIEKRQEREEAKQAKLELAKVKKLKADEKRAVVAAKKVAAAAKLRSTTHGF